MQHCVGTPWHDWCESRTLAETRQGAYAAAASPLAERPRVLWALQHHHPLKHREDRPGELDGLALRDLGVQRLRLVR